MKTAVKRAVKAAETAVKTVAKDGEDGGEYCWDGGEDGPRGVQQAEDLLPNGWVTIEYGIRQPEGRQGPILYCRRGLTFGVRIR